ncbi:unnamed protein product [Ceutorhynchus assimilis]|uniref:Uncharacterized protein n=1 Tax=Ceutorhynchus assimilis TaxID=467358 RepID=A0A9N9QMY6_9CUCU|nr:unnamed protein product [Ceutorhynchus assimilis]
MKSATKSSDHEVSQSSYSPRRTCPCRSSTRSSAKIHRAKSANGSTHAPYAYGKIEMRSPTRNAKIQICSTITKTPSSYQNVCTFASAESSAKLDKFSKSLMETDKVVNELKDEIVQLQHQLHHVLQNQMRSSGPKIEIPCPIKGPSVPVEYANYSNMKECERLKREIDWLNREKEAVEADKRMLKKSWNDLSDARAIVSKYDKKVDLLNTEVHKTLKAVELERKMFCECIKAKDEKIRSLQESHLKMAGMLEEQNSIINNKEMERDMLYVNRTIFKENNDYLKQSIVSLRHTLLDSTVEVLTQKGNNKQLKKDLSDANIVCMKLVSKTKKEKKTYQSRIKSIEDELKESASKIDQLTEKLYKANQEKNGLKNKYQELQSTIHRYERVGSSFKQLECDCKIEHETMSDILKMYDKEKQDMKKLIEELHGVVEQKNITLERITKINKEQESLIKEQQVKVTEYETDG